MSASCRKRNDLIKGFGDAAGAPLTIFVSILKLFISRTCELLSFAIGACCLISRHGCRTFTTHYCLSFYRPYLRARPLYTPLVYVDTQLALRCIYFADINSEINKAKWRTRNWIFCMTCPYTNLQINGSEIEIATKIPVH